MCEGASCILFRLPPPALPHFDLFPSLVVDAISISAVVMAIHVSLAKVLAKKYQYEIDSNQVSAEQY